MVRGASPIVIFLVVVALAGAAGTADARTGARGRSDPCGGSHPATSAINQYCEVVPSTTGGNRVGPRTPELPTTLPFRTAYRLWTNPARRRLLTLPAPAFRPGSLQGAASSDSTGVGGAVSSSVVWMPILLALGVVAAFLLAIDQARRLRARRRRGDGLSHTVPPTSG
jgi:hypothetical protein